MRDKGNILTPKLIGKYAVYLREQERAENTVQKYMHDLTVLWKWLDGRPLEKAALIEWKKHLTAIYAATSVNSMLAAVNGFLQFIGRKQMSVKPLKIQKKIFRDEDRELSKEEYRRLVKAAKQEGNERLALVLQTICATGIRVSELKFITVEAVRLGRTEINNKGKFRTVFLPGRLREQLKKYLRKEKCTRGIIFVTRAGKPLDRSNIWRDMKRLCKSAQVDPKKVFPHNLRHLFARTYYSIEKDISRLADILGHSNIDTTRIYIIESGKIHARQMERMGLVIT